MKKIIAFALCLLMILTACGRAKTTDSDGSDGSVIQGRPNPLDSPYSQSLELAVYKDETTYLAIKRMADVFAGMHPNVTLNITVIGSRDDYAILLKEK
ncbi:MAG: hypothetical protein FWE82_10405, partial [Defluviitaleaceae bacterium]|nr:hypothetical protein [Defluviitaleaceae bacterium]